MKSQKDEIIIRLIKGQKLTGLDGMRMTNKTMNLRNRVGELRRDEGYEIHDEWVVTDKTKVKRYFIPKEKRELMRKKFLGL